MAIVDALLRCWRENGERWEPVATAAREAGLEAWNPARYAFDTFETFLRRFPPRRGAVMGVGLNPGPYGMAQTGIPFTDCRTAREVLGIDLDIPGRAPADLARRLRKPNGRWRQTYERSSLGIYSFLREAWGAPEAALANWFVANPCPLLFLDPEAWNVTPADPRLKRIEGMQALRLRAIDAFAGALEPRAIVLLGNDVAAVAGDLATKLVGAERFVAYRHPAREPPKAWGTGLARELERRGLLTR